MVEGLISQGLIQLLFQFLVAGARAQKGLQVGHFFGEEAGLELAI